jgi:pterin-4a-carbinolamine dehydratase
LWFACASFLFGELHSLQKLPALIFTVLVMASGSPQGPKHCAPCSTLDASFLLTFESAVDKLGIRGSLWNLCSSESEPLHISRKFTARNFQSALKCINEMGAIAERESHHPDFHLTSYRDIEVKIWTHKLQGLTEKDLDLAALLDKEVKINYSPKWLRDNPDAKRTAAHD